MKNERQEKILAIIAASAIETQEQLIDSLRKEGISCTQGDHLPRYQAAPLN